MKTTTCSDRIASFCATLLLAAALIPAARAAGALDLHTLDEMAPDMYLGPGKMLSDLRGHWVLLHFWATWCEPCIDELPALERFYRRGDRQFEFVTVAMDGKDADAVIGFRAQFGITLPVVMEPDAGGHRPYTGWGLPATYFIAPDGRVIGRALGVRDWDKVETGPLLQRLGGE